MLLKYLELKTRKINKLLRLVMMDKKEKISIYIPTKNSNKYLKESLKYFKNLNKKDLIKEILMIDFSSSKEKEEIKNILNFCDDWLKTKIKIVNQKESGLAKARNIAIKKSNSELIASLDADCIPSKNWLAQLLKTMEEDKAEGVCGRVVELEKLENTSLADKWRAKHLKQDFGNKKIINPPYLIGANTLFKKEVLEKVGLYNEKYKSNYEDVDISKRLIAKGYKLVYEPKAIVYHIKKDNILSVLKTNWAWGFYGNEPNSIISLIKRFVFNFYISLKYAFEDLLNLNVEFLVIDFLIIPINFYFDLLWVIKNLRERK